MGHGHPARGVGTPTRRGEAAWSNRGATNVYGRCYPKEPLAAACFIEPRSIVREYTHHGQDARATKSPLCLLGLDRRQIQVRDDNDVSVGEADVAALSRRIVPRRAERGIVE